jgi:hypothetical protein
MSMELTFHDVTSITYVTKNSKISKDMYYTDMIVTCENGNEEVITFFSEKEVPIKEKDNEYQISK